LSVLNKKMRNREEEKARYRSRIQNAQRILDSPQADVQDAMQRTAQEKVTCEVQELAMLLICFRSAT